MGFCVENNLLKGRDEMGVACAGPFAYIHDMIVDRTCSFTGSTYHGSYRFGSLE